MKYPEYIGKKGNRHYFKYNGEELLLSQVAKRFNQYPETIKSKILRGERDPERLFTKQQSNRPAQYGRRIKPKTDNELWNYLLGNRNAKSL